MRNIRERAKLSLEAIDVRGLGAGQGLQRNRLIHLTVVRFVNHSHAAGAQRPAQNEAFSADEFCCGLNHAGMSHKGGYAIRLTD